MCLKHAENDLLYCICYGLDVDFPCQTYALEILEISGTWMSLWLGANALVIVCSGTWMSVWCGHGCSGERMLWNMDVILVWACMLW